MATRLVQFMNVTGLAAATTTDANDFLWQWGSSADYDASPGLGEIEATVLAINAADDERNAMKQVKNGRLFLILTSDETSGHLKREVLQEGA